MKLKVLRIFRAWSFNYIIPPFSPIGFHQVWHSGFIYAISSLSSINNYDSSCEQMFISATQWCFAIIANISLWNWNISSYKKVWHFVWPKLIFHQRTAKDHFREVKLNLHEFFFGGLMYFCYLDDTSIYYLPGSNHLFTSIQVQILTKIGIIVNEIKKTPTICFGFLL